MLDHQVLALYSLEDDLRGKLSDHLGHVIDHLVQDELLDVNSEEYDLLQHHGMLTSRQRVSELLKQLCQLSGEKGKSAFAKFMHALREIGFSAEAKFIEETSHRKSAKGVLYPETGLQWKSSYMFKSHAPSVTLPSTRPVRECVEVYRNHLLSICREQRWRSLLPEIRTPGADIGDWFVSVQALSSWQAMQGSAANQSAASAAQLGEGFSVSEPVQLLMQFPHLYESAMDVDEIEFVKSCMVLSCAGTGKTTLCRRLLANYTRRVPSRLQEKFPFPVYIQCGDVDRLNATDWETVLGVNGADLRAVLSGTERKLVVEYLLGHAQDLLLIIDGVDEVREGEFAVNGSKLSGVLCQDRKALKGASLFMTSRSCKAASSLVPQCASLYALAGFTEEQLEQYMAKRLGLDRGKQCMEALCDASLSHVKEAIRAVPLFAALVAEEYWRASAIPPNVTSLYGGYLHHAGLRWRARCDRKMVSMKGRELHESAMGKGDDIGASCEYLPCNSDDHHLHSRPAARQESSQRRPPTIAEEYHRAAKIPLNVTSLYGGHLRRAQLLRAATRRDRNAQASAEKSNVDGSASADSGVMEGSSEPLSVANGRHDLHSTAAAPIDLSHSPLPHPPEDLFETLSAKALDMLRRGQRSSSVSFFTPEVADFGHAIGVLSSGATIPLDIYRESIEFNHASYQEYLAAANVSRDPSPVEAAKQCVQSFGIKVETWPFWQFLCGLVDSHHLLGILSLLKSGQQDVLPKKLTCFLMLCLLENQSQSKSRKANAEAAVAIFGLEMDMSHYHMSKLETVGLANVLQLVPCEELNLMSCGISGDQVNLLGDQLPLVPLITLAGNNLHGHPLERVAAAIHRAPRVKTRVLYLDICDLSGEDGVSIAYLMQFTQSLDLGDMDPSALPVIAERMVPSPNLRKLYMRSCNLPGGSGADICRIVEFSPSLTHLHLCDNNLSTDDADQLLVQLSGSQIRGLMLQNNAIYGDITASLATLLQAIDCRPSRELSCRVFLEGNDVHRSCLESVREADCGARSQVAIGPYFLKSGEIYGVNCANQLSRGQEMCRSGVNDAMARDIAEFMAQDTTLGVLDLGHNQISDEGACYLAASLKNNSTMQILELYHNRIGLSGLKALLEGVSSAPRLPRALRLIGCPVFHSVLPSHPDLRSLLKLSRCDNLRVLVLSNTGLSSEVGILLAEALKWNTSLAMIGLSKNRLDDVFAGALARSLEDNITLQEVMLADNQITEAGVRQMLQCLGIQRLQCVWMCGNPCPPRWYRHPLVNARWIGVADDFKQFLQK